LTYLPFSALINNYGRNKSKYAVEDFNFGYLSSMYLYNLVYNIKSTSSENSLLIGDPDGSLPGARKEVEEINTYFNSNHVYLGKEATIANFLNNAENSKIIHLATHGYLDRKSLKDSWLLFADEKFNMSQAFNLPLGNTDLVVLSACETGFGGEGLEYATLARAFSNAGAPTVIATLWQVNDDASQQLMTMMYKNLGNGMNKFEALASAQRTLLQNGVIIHPSLWSSYIPIGRP